jgi:type I restriction enzyme S subunit
VTTTAELSAVADIFNGKTPPREEQREAGFPVLKIRDVDDNGSFRGRFESFVDLSFAKKFSDRWVQEDDILILNAAHNAEYVASKIYKADAEVAGSLGTGEWLFVRSRNAHPGYIYHYLRSAPARASLRDFVKGIHLYPKDVARLRLPMPRLDEQRRIVAILDQVDGLRRQRREAFGKAATLPSMLFLEMFGDWSRPGFNGRLIQLAERLDFLTSGSRGWAEYYRETGSLFLRIQNVKRDELDLDDVAYVEPPNTAEAQRTRVRPGDVLLSITADLGRTAVVPEGIGEAFINQHLSILRSSKIEPRYLSAAISSRAGQLAIQSKNREGVKAGLNFDDVRSLKIPDADIDLQRAFAVRALEMDKLKANHRLHLAKLDAMFASLQHRAFRGEL